MVEDKRCFYRVQLPLDFSKARVSKEGNTYLEAEVLDTSYGGVGLAIHGELAEQIRRGDAVTLDLSGMPGLGAAPEVKSVVRHLAVLAGGQGVYAGVQFEDPATLHAKAHPEAYKLLNRRKVMRVQPPGGLVGQIGSETDSWESLSTEILVDLSIGGLALLVSRKTADALGAQSRVRVAFCLPGPESRIRVPATVKYRARRGAVERWGLCFEGVDDDWQGQQQAISQYVMDLILEGIQGT